MDLGAVLGEIVRRASGDSSSLGILRAVSPGLGTGVRHTIEMPPPDHGFLECAFCWRMVTPIYAYGDTNRESVTRILN